MRVYLKTEIPDQKYSTMFIKEKCNNNVPVNVSIKSNQRYKEKTE